MKIYIKNTYNAPLAEQEISKSALQLQKMDVAVESCRITYVLFVCLCGVQRHISTKRLLVPRIGEDKISLKE